MKSLTKDGIVHAEHLKEALRRGEEPYFVQDEDGDLISIEDLAYSICDSKEELRNWIDIFLWMDFPEYVVCPELGEGIDEKVSPMDMIWNCYTQMRDGVRSQSRQLYFASRDSFKTLSAAVVEFLALVHFKRTAGHMGAIQAQADKCYSYFKNFMKKHPFRTIPLESDSRSKTILKFPDRWGYYPELEKMTCSASGCNSAHHSMFCVDEVDLIEGDKMRGYNESKFVPTDTLDKKPPLTLYISTRKSTFGLVQQEIDVKDESGLRVRGWNIVDVTQPCPPSKSRMDEGRTLTKYFKIDERLNLLSQDEFDKLLPDHKIEYDPVKLYPGCDKCGLAPLCLGKLATDQKSTSSMLKAHELVEDIFKSNPDDAVAQLMCLKPSAKGLVFTSFSPLKSVVDEKRMYEIFTGEVLGKDVRITHDQLIDKFKEHNIEAFCFDKDTELMTPTGWKKISDLRSSDRIACSNENGNMVYHSPTRYVMRIFEGDMVKINSVFVDLRITSDHDQVIYDADTMIEHKVKAKDLPDSFYVRTNPRRGCYGRGLNVPKEFDFLTPKQFAGFMGIFLACGRIEEHYGPMEDWNWGFSLFTSNGKLIEKIDRFFETTNWPEGKFGGAPVDRFEQVRNGERGVCWLILGGDRTRFLKERVCHPIYGIDDLMLTSMTHEELYSFYKWAVNVSIDSVLLRRNNKEKKKTISYFSHENSRIVDQVQEICFRMGDMTRKLGSGTETILMDYGPSTGFAYIEKDRNVTVEHTDKEETYCVTVPTGKVWTRRNGKIAESGNCGIDWGWEDPNVAIVAYIDGNENIYIVREIRMTHVHASDFLEIIQTSLHYKYNIQMYFPDTAAPASVNLLRKANLPVVGKIDKDIHLGVQTIKRYMRPPGTRDTKIYILDTCGGLIEEIKRYHYKLDAATGEVVAHDKYSDKDNHGIDAIRYMIHSILGRSGAIIGVLKTPETQGRVGVKVDNKNRVGELVAPPTITQMAQMHGIPGFRDDSDLYFNPDGSMKSREEIQKIMNELYDPNSTKSSGGSGFNFSF